MARRPIPTGIQELVLLYSRRRCCICFGLHRDTRIKQGQIAHLDRESSNNSPDNLIFLCLDHHDQYDSRTSQSKNFTLAEIRSYRRELEIFLKINLEQTLSVSNHERPLQAIDGTYIRALSDESAEMRINRLASRRYTYHVSGFAVWGTTTGLGQHIGEIEFKADLQNNRIVYKKLVPWRTSKNGVEVYHEVVLEFQGNTMYVSEKNWSGMYGMNVNFEGKYLRIGAV